MQLREFIDRYRLTAAILAAGLVLEAFFVVMHGINKEAFGDGYFFSLDNDLSLPSWATCVLFAWAGSVCALFAVFERAARRPFAALGVISFGLSMEQFVQLHGRVEESVADPGSKLIEIFLGVAIVVAIVLAARVLSPPFRQLLLGSIAILVISSLSSQANQSLDPPYVGVIFFQTVEEIFEMLTATLIIAATVEPLWDSIQRHVRGGPGAS